MHKLTYFCFCFNCCSYCNYIKFYKVVQNSTWRELQTRRIREEESWERGWNGEGYVH